MVRLLLLSGSRQSEQAEQLLKERHVSFERVDVSESHVLSGLNRDLGVSRLPALIDRQAKYEGIDCIRGYLDSSR
jgi:hypothetical protein